MAGRAGKVDDDDDDEGVELKEALGMYPGCWGVFVCDQWGLMDSK